MRCLQWYWARREQVAFGNYGETELSDPVDADDGVIECEPDECDIEDGVTAVDIAVRSMLNESCIHPSASSFCRGIWYSYNTLDIRTGDDIETDMRPHGFSEEEEREIFERITSR